MRSFGTGCAGRRLAGLAFAFCLIAAAVAMADNEFVPVYHPTLEIARISGSIKIDGNLDDSGWHAAARAGNFAEHQPGDQVQPPVATEALITYDDQNLYVAFICHDDPLRVRASLCDRERMFNDDNVAVLIDTYGDAAWAYEIFANPYGIQGDGLWSRNGGEDMSIDFIFESAGKVTGQGYQVEMAIPFSSLRFPDQVEQAWRMDFWRNHPREAMGKYSWAAYDRDDPCWPCKWGTVTGIENVEPGRGVELMPTLVGYQSGELNAADDFHNEDPDGQVSIGGKYSITSNITAEATYNPDFSQIESDASQIDVNTTFALSYPERRPFFQEGSDLFRSWMSIVYTRSINNPEFAGKLIARLDRTSFAYLVARDEDTPIILPFGEGSAYLLSGKSTSSIFRARHELGDDTHIGLLLTDRRLDGGGSGTVINLDGQVKFSKHIRVQWQAAATHTEEPDDEELSSEIQEWVDWGMIPATFAGGRHTAAYDGESYWGHALVVNLEQRSRNWGMDFAYIGFDRKLRVDNGFEPRNDHHIGEGDISYTYYAENSVIEYINPSVEFGRRWDWQGIKKDEWACTHLSVQLKVWQAQMHAQAMTSAENFGGVQFDDIWNLHNCVHLNPSDLLSFGGSVNYGHRIARRNLRMGMEWYLSGWFDIKPIDRLLIENWFDYNKSDDLYSGEELFDGYIYRTRLNLQLTRRFSMRWVIEYDNFDEDWEIAPLLTYRLSPFSVFYLGSTYSYENFDKPDGNGHLHNSNRLNSRQFFAKLQYLFQI